MLAIISKRQFRFFSMVIASEERFREDLAVYYDQVVYDNVLEQYKGKADTMREDLSEKYGIPFPQSQEPVRQQLRSYYEKVVFDKLIGMYDGSVGKTEADLWAQLESRYKEKATRRIPAPPANKPDSDPAQDRHPAARFAHTAMYWTGRGGWKDRDVVLENGELVIIEEISKSAFLCFSSTKAEPLSRVEYITSKTACLEMKDIDSLPRAEVEDIILQDLDVLGIMVDAHIGQAKPANIVFLKFSDSKAAGQLRTSISQTISRHVFPTRDIGAGGFHSELVAELETQSGKGNKNTKVFRFTTTPKHRYLTTLSVRIFSQLNGAYVPGSDQLVQRKYVGEYYRFMTIFLKSAPLRGFLLVCDWERITPGV